MSVETKRVTSPPGPVPEVEQLRTRVGQLQSALDSRVVIEQAKGVLAERYDLAIAEAFRLLRYAARSERQNIHELAAAVVKRPREMPEAVLVALARAAHWRAAAQREGSRAEREQQALAQRKEARAQVRRTGETGLSR